METEQMAEVYGAPGTRPSDREEREPQRAPKVQRKVDHLKTMNYETTPAQRLQRAETTAGAAVDEVIHFPTSPAWLQAAALEVIDSTPTKLKLGFAEWRAVQDLVEAAILVGLQMDDEEPLLEPLG